MTLSSEDCYSVSCVRAGAGLSSSSAHQISWPKSGLPVTLRRPGPAADEMAETGETPQLIPSYPSANNSRYKVVNLCDKSDNWG